jgi:outer membrane protein assembly factor BamB
LTTNTLTQDQDWPTFEHDFLRSSLQPGSSQISKGTVTKLQRIWQFKSTTSFDLASPIEVAGVVYAIDLGGTLTALNDATGAVLWQKELGPDIKMTPALLDGHLFVGTYVYTSPSAVSMLYALDPATGGVQWQRAINGGIHGSPVTIGGRLAVPVAIGDPGFCHPGGIYLFDEQTGDTGLNWLTGGATPSDGGGIWSPLSFDGSEIRFGSGNTCLDSPNTANAIVALSTALSTVWADQTASALSDDDVGGGVLVAGSNAYVSGKNGNIYDVNPINGDILWQRALGAPDGSGAYSTPALAGSTLISSIGYRLDPYASNPPGTEYGQLVGLDPNSGAQRWSVEAIEPFYNPPAIVGNVAFTMSDANVVAIDPSSGETLWSDAIQTGSRTQPIVADNKLFVADEDGDFYAYAIPTAGTPAFRRHVAVSSGRHLVPFVNFIPWFCRPH